MRKERGRFDAFYPLHCGTKDCTGSRQVDPRTKRLSVEWICTICGRKNVADRAALHDAQSAHVGRLNELFGRGGMQ